MLTRRMRIQSVEAEKKTNRRREFLSLDPIAQNKGRCLIAIHLVIKS